MYLPSLANGMRPQSLEQALAARQQAATQNTGQQAPEQPQFAQMQNQNTQASEALSRALMEQARSAPTPQSDLEGAANAARIIGSALIQRNANRQRQEQVENILNQGEFTDQQRAAAVANPDEFLTWNNSRIFESPEMEYRRQRDSVQDDRYGQERADDNARYKNEFQYRSNQDQIQNALSARQMQVDAAAAQNARFGDVTDAEDDLRGEFGDVFGDFNELMRSYDVIEQSYNVDSPQGDLALIVAYTKALDPGSVAREGEVQLSQSSASWMQNIGNLQRRIQEGQTRLPPDVRDELLRWARSMRAVDQQSFDVQQASYADLVDRRGLNPANVFVHTRPESLPPVVGAAEAPQQPSLQQPSLQQPSQQQQVPRQPSLQSGPQEGDTATNPNTGQRIIYRNGDWGPM